KEWKEPRPASRRAPQAAAEATAARPAPPACDSSVARGVHAPRMDSGLSGQVGALYRVGSARHASWQDLYCAGRAVASAPLAGVGVGLRLAGGDADAAGILASQPPAGTSTTFAPRGGNSGFQACTAWIADRAVRGSSWAATSSRFLAASASPSRAASANHR